MDLWKEHTDVIAKQGLRVEGASGDRVVKGIQIAATAEQIGSCDLVVIATKASGVAPAAAMIAPIVTKDTVVLTIQNGLGAGERIQNHLPVENILLGVAQGFGASMKAPGHVHHTAMSMIRIGSMTDSADPRNQDIVSVWQDAGFNASAYDDIHQLIWEKFICNVAYSAPCTVFEKSVSELLADEYGKSISQNCAIEAWNVAVAKGINLTFSDPVEYVTDFGYKVGNSSPSMRIDHQAKRASEIDAINGMVPVVASEHGMSAPYNNALSSIVRSREAGWYLSEL
jgi:2-dehydropantoate 2-reductase